MSLSTRVRHHIRSNVVAYVALFAALGGTAIALPGQRTVKSDDIARNAVKKKAIDGGAVRNQELAAGAVSATKLRDGSVVQSKLGDGAVSTSKLLDEAVARAKIAAGSVNGGKLANASVNSSKVRDGTLEAVDFAPGQLSDGFLLEAGGGQFTAARPGRLLVIATFFPTCGAAECTYSINVDGAAAPGATFTGPAPAGQLTLIGIKEVTAGAHPVGLSLSGLDSGAAEPRISGILLQ